jgi:hypothetical protein
MTFAWGISSFFLDLTINHKRFMGIVWDLTDKMEGIKARNQPWGFNRDSMGCITT